MNVIITLLFFMLLILFVSALVGAVMFCIDICKWSKRPERYTTIHEDLQSDDDEDDDI